LEGLEISEVKYSYLLSSNDIFRFDSGFFLKEYINDEGLVLKLSNKSLSELFEDIKSFGAYSLNNHVTYQDYGIPFIRGVNMKNGKIDFSNMIYIDSNANKLLWKSEVKPDMILLSMSGTLGDVAIASKCWKYPINSNQDIAKIELGIKSNAQYIYTFLLSKYGQNYIKREARGSVQQHVFLSQIEQFIIPLFSVRFEQKIQLIIETIEDLDNRSKTTYTQAENLLLETLGLKGFKPSKEKINIKSFKESFLLSGRLDAEYYQEKYEEIEEKLKSTPHWDFLGKLIEKIDTGEYSPEYFVKGEKKDLTFYIRSTNIKDGQIDIDNNYFVSKNLFNRVAKKGNIVTARVGSVGVFGEIRNELDGAIYSDNVLCFQLPNNYIPSVYSLLFNSKYYFELIDRLSRGSVQQRLNQETLKDLIIPTIDFKIQQQISDKIEESFLLKEQSEELLELAKAAVEMAIEEDEERGMGFIEKGFIEIENQ